ncbi:hypothetical protein LCGC14_0768000 [marine sediment metagenome]|uniref:Uncharacterized protein n=1 Tax=marine sediment metagenome TaxID=412755 RepID=A0A0F9Q3B9_9ZZZZ
MSRVIPFFAETATATIVIDGVTYRVPLIDSDGHLQVDVVSNALPTGAATSAKQDTMITALQLIDDLRGALDAVQADRLNVNVKIAGASEVMGIRKRTDDPSTTRVTAVTPTSGKKIRLISCQTRNLADTLAAMEVYFGTGANIATNPDKVILDTVLRVTVMSTYGVAWPDGAGPVGAVGEVVSVRTSQNVTTQGVTVIHYREE